MVFLVLDIFFYYRSLGGVLIGSLDVLCSGSASIIPVLPPVSSGKRSGKLSGRAYFTPPSKEKRKAEPLVFQRDSAICENFSKKSVLSRKISRRY